MIYVDIRVTIEITYDSPDTYPTYSPPNYRTASSVSLRCVATGTTGSVTYRWSSTCRSDCFAYNSSLQTISEPFLRARDAGVHTCRVTDGAGNSGSNSTTMNIMGECIDMHTHLPTRRSSNNKNKKQEDTGHMQMQTSIVANRTETGGTVPIFLPLHRNYRTPTLHRLRSKLHATPRKVTGLLGSKYTNC